MSMAWFQSRYDKAGPGGTGADYINCPMTREQYDAFVDALLAGDKTAFHEWEAATPYFDGCLPIEVMAERGRETLRHGPMKPFGLTNPHAPEREALRRRAAAPGQHARHALQHGRLPDQAEARRAGAHLPHHSRACRTREFARLGGLHRNTFLNSPKLLDETLRLKAKPRLRFAGQITGCEGYVESAAIGLLAGRFAAAERRGEPLVAAAADHRARRAARPHHRRPYRDDRRRAASFQPMNINFGLFPPLAQAPDFDRKSPLGRGTAKTLAKKSAISAPRARRSRRWTRRRRRSRGGIVSLRRSGADPRAARHSSHCRRHGDNGSGANGS